MKRPVLLLAIIYGIMIIVIFVLPFYSSETYSIFRNTTSQLGAQHTPNAWIMNVTFVGLGIGSVVAGWSFYRTFWMHRITLLIFGISLLLAGIFHHAPVDPDIPFDQQADELHSLFASITGFSFTLLSIATGFILKETSAKVIAIGVGILATLLSLLMFNVPEYMGIWQRMIFVFCFGWMLSVFRNENSLTDRK